MKNCLPKKLTRILLTAFCLSLFSTLSAKEPKLHIFTVASSWSIEFDQLVDSCDLQNLPIDVVGIGGRLYVDRKFALSHQRVSRWPDEDVVLFIRANKGLVLASEETILERFLSFKAPIVFSGKVNAPSLPGLRKYFPPRLTKFKYPNSDAYIGYVKDVREMLSDYNGSNSGMDEEKYLSLYYLYHLDEIAIDSLCQLFLPLGRVDSEEVLINSEAVQLIGSDNSACIVTGSAGEGSLYEEIYDKVVAP